MVCPRKRDNLKTVADIQTKFYTGILWHNTMNWFEIGDDRIKIVTLIECFCAKVNFFYFNLISQWIFLKLSMNIL